MMEGGDRIRASCSKIFASLELESLRGNASQQDTVAQLN